MTRVRPSVVLVGAAFVATLAGHFTLERIGLSIPVLNDVRVLLFTAVVLSFLLEQHHAGEKGRWHDQGAARALYPILLLLAYQILSASWAPRGAIISDVLSDLVSMGVLLIVYANLAVWDRDRVIRITFALLYIAGWLYFLYAASGRGHTASGRWAAFGGGPNVFVRVMVLGIFAAAYFYFRNNGKLYWLIGVPPFLVGALASGSRGGLAALGIATVVALPSLWPTIRSMRFVKAVAALAVLLGILWSLIGAMVTDLLNNRLVATTLQNRYTSDRDVLYEKGVEVFTERPILGSGVHGFYAITNLGPGERYVHNLPLAVAAEGGAVGLVLLLFAFWSLRTEFARLPVRQRSLESRAAAYAGIFVLGASFFSGDYYDTRLMWIMWLLAAIHPASVIIQNAGSTPLRVDHPSAP
ncbi:O-antigen ligase family protein [Actinoplanes sp. CA-131856]